MKHITNISNFTIKFENWSAKGLDSKDSNGLSGKTKKNDKEKKYPKHQIENIIFVGKHLSFKKYFQNFLENIIKKGYKCGLKHIRNIIKKLKIIKQKYGRFNRPPKNKAYY